MTSDTSKIAAEDKLAKEIRALQPDGSKKEILAVDDRVLARVTDGIYRQPSSAIRELISNAYDADATKVVVHTDAPRFNRIVIRDNGQGMSPEVLAYLIKHIGGSSKRTQRGKELGTVSKDSASKTLSGRKLIGKIGIGMFAVSQLTQHFQIITKQKGDDFTTSAVVILETHSEELLADEEGEFKTGEVLITRIPTSDLDAHGTDIVLMNLRKSARDDLASLDRWQALETDESHETEDGFLGNVAEPIFHIGRMDPSSHDKLLQQPKLPWDNQDSPEQRFKKLYEAISQEVDRTSSNPTTASVLDNYLKMLWDISLAVPVGYIDKHPFDTTQSDGVDLYEISNNKQKGQATPLNLENSQSVADFFHMESRSQDPVGGFKVIIDDVELLHPIKIDPILRSTRGKRPYAQKQPLLFIGKCVTPFSNIASNRGGGALEFEAYIYWNPLITPKENNGVLIRVNSASGTLFDETFLDYRVSELTRLKQMMAEVYVTKGLDPALNIDRESFNSSHPHYQFIQDWLHRAIRQATNRLKATSKEVLDKNKDERSETHRTALATHVDSVWTKLHGDAAFPPEVALVEHVDLADEAERREGKLIIEHTISIPSTASLAERARSLATQTARIKAIASVLAAYGLTEIMPYHRLEALINDIDSVYRKGDE